MGLMVGIAFADDVKAADVRAACERKGLLVLTAKTRLRLLPPLILSEADVAKHWLFWMTCFHPCN